jgi:hypothetical protein
MGTSAPPKTDIGTTRAFGIYTAIALSALAFASYVLPRSLATFGVGVFALLGAVQFLFHGGTLVSMRLEGWRRAQFQVVVSLATAVMFAMFLASQADMVTATLYTTMTPRILIFLGITAWVCWLTGNQLNHEHPFRGFVIAAAVLFVWCLYSGAIVIVSAPDWDDEAWFGWHFDPDRAKRANATGEYVWQYILYVATAYLALFLKLRFRRQRQR